jgi:hypothetical protein
VVLGITIYGKSSKIFVLLVLDTDSKDFLYKENNSLSTSNTSKELLNLTDVTPEPQINSKNFISILNFIKNKIK